METQTDPPAETPVENEKDDLIKATELAVEMWATAGIVSPVLLYASPFILWSVAFGAFSPKETVIASLVPILITTGGTAFLVHSFNTNSVWEPNSNSNKITRRTALTLTVIPGIVVISLVAYDYFLLHEMVIDLQEAELIPDVVATLQILRVAVYSMIGVVLVCTVMLYRALKN